MQPGAKSRNGCARCKGQRLKCDEGKPACARCVRVGAQCPGYAKSLRWSTKHEVSRPLQKTQGSKRSKKISQARERTSSMPMSHDLPSTKPAEEEGQGQTPHVPTLEVQPNDLFWDENSRDLLSDIDLDDLLYGSDPIDWPLDASSAFTLDTATSLSGVQGEQVDCSPNPINNDIISSGPYVRVSPGDFVDDEEDLQSRLSPSRLSHSPAALVQLQRGLNDPSSTLVEYYFKDVAGLISCYDSQMNPFRSIVSRLWTSSPILCRTLQSMAASCLVDEFPHLAGIGIQLRREAFALIEMEQEMDEKSLLALLMLGETAAWHDTSDLGVPCFNRLKNTLKKLSLNAKASDMKNILFFQEALVYWEMLLSYMADDSTMVISNWLDQQQGDVLEAQQRPHPWTGIAQDTQITLQEIGRLVRGERKRVRQSSLADIDRANAAIKKARMLEDRLLHLNYPSELEIINPGDCDTPVWHLLTLAEVYRCTGLIQLYRVFPDLLDQHMRAEQEGGKSSPKNDETDIFQALSESALKDIEADRRDWLTNLGMTTLNLLRSLPISSKTQSLTPFLLVALSSELRLPPDAVFDEEGPGLNESLKAQEISQMRKFITSRLKLYLRLLPPKPIHICLTLVREVWSRMDRGVENVFWMDVMIQNGWETTMG